MSYSTSLTHFDWLRFIAEILQPLPQLKCKIFELDCTLHSSRATTNSKTLTSQVPSALVHIPWRQSQPRQKKWEILRSNKCRSREFAQAKIQRRELTSTCRGWGCAKWHSARTSALWCSQPGRREGGKEGSLPAARCPDLIPSNGPFSQVRPRKEKAARSSFKHSNIQLGAEGNSCTGLSSTSSAYHIIDHCFESLM